jgi:hypothetical protein
MFETMFAFIAGFLFTWPALVGLFVLGVVFEAASWRKMAVFIALIAGLSAYFYFDVPLLMLLAYAVGYLAIGVVWSFWRYKRHTAKIVAEVKEFSASYSGQHLADYKERMIRAMKPSNMISTFVFWIIVWPFSFVENFIGDAIRAIEALVKQVFRGVYNRIYESAVRSLN